jgi:hypothetical protein
MLVGLFVVEAPEKAAAAHGAADACPEAA